MNMYEEAGDFATEDLLDELRGEIRQLREERDLLREELGRMRHHYSAVGTYLETAATVVTHAIREHADLALPLGRALSRLEPKANPSYGCNRCVFTWPARDGAACPLCGEAYTHTDAGEHTP